MTRKSYYGSIPINVKGENEITQDLVKGGRGRIQNMLLLFDDRKNYNNINNNINLNNNININNNIDLLFSLLSGMYPGFRLDNKNGKFLNTELFDDVVSVQKIFRK